MAPPSSKLALEYGYVHQAIPVFRKSPLAQFIFLCVAAYSTPTPESTLYTILYVTAIFTGLFFIIINRQEGFERASRLEKFEPNFMDFITAMEDQRGFFQLDVRSQSDAIRLCSSTVIMHCLASKQKAEALYSVALEASTSSSDLLSIGLDLWSQKSHMESFIGSYLGFRPSLVDDTLGKQLREFEETSQEWVTRMNNNFNQRRIRSEFQQNERKPRLKTCNASIELFRRLYIYAFPLLGTPFSGLISGASLEFGRDFHTNPDPRWMDSEAGTHQTLWCVFANISNAARGLSQQRTEDGTAFIYRLCFDIILLFGGAELKAQGLIKITNTGCREKGTGFYCL